MEEGNHGKQDIDKSYLRFAATAGPMTEEEREYRIRKGIQEDAMEEDCGETRLSFHLTGDELIVDAKVKPKGPAGTSEETAAHCSQSKPVFSIAEMVEEAAKINAEAALHASPAVAKSLAPVQEQDEDDAMITESHTATDASHNEDNFPNIDVSEEPASNVATSSVKPGTKDQMKTPSLLHEEKKTPRFSSAKPNRKSGLHPSSASAASTPLGGWQYSSGNSSLFVNFSSFQELNTSFGSNDGGEPESNVMNTNEKPQSDGDFAYGTEGDLFEESKLSELGSLCEAMSINCTKQSDSVPATNATEVANVTRPDSCASANYSYRGGLRSLLGTPRPPDLLNSLLVNVSSKSALAQHLDLANESLGTAFDEDSFSVGVDKDLEDDDGEEWALTGEDVVPSTQAVNVNNVTDESSMDLDGSFVPSTPMVAGSSTPAIIPLSSSEVKECLQELEAEEEDRTDEIFLPTQYPTKIIGCQHPEEDMENNEVPATKEQNTANVAEESYHDIELGTCESPSVPQSCYSQDGIQDGTTQVEKKLPRKSRVSSVQLNVTFEKDDFESSSSSDSEQEQNEICDESNMDESQAEYENSGLNKENYSPSPRKLNSFYTTGSDTDLDDTITNMERLLALADQAELAAEQGGAAPFEFDLEPFPANLPCSFIEDELAQKGQGEELQQVEGMQLDVNSEDAVGEVILSPNGKAKEISKKIGFKKVIANELMLSPVAPTSPSPSTPRSASKKSTPIKSPRSISSKTPSPSPKSAKPAAANAHSDAIIFKTPAVPSKTPSKFKRADDLPGKSPSPAVGKTVAMLRGQGPSSVTPKKFTTSTPLQPSKVKPVPLLMNSPASTIGYPTPPSVRDKNLGNPKAFQKVPSRFRNQKATISPFMLPRKSPIAGPGGEPRLMTLVSPVADYIYNSPPVQQLQQQQRSNIRNHFGPNVVQSLPRKIRRPDDDKAKVSAIPIRKASLPVPSKNQGNPIVSPAPPVSKKPKMKQVSTTDSPALINFDSPAEGLTDCSSPALMDFDSPTSCEVIEKNKENEEESGDGFKIQVPVDLPSDSGELQDLMELSTVKIRESEHKDLKKVRYFGSEKLRDGKERTVEAPIIPFTQSNPIIVLGLCTKDNLVAQRHTGLMSESFGTSIVRSEPVIKSSIPSRIASIAHKK